MTREQARASEQGPLFLESLEMRRWDEQAKLEGVPVIDLATIRRKAVDVLASQGVPH